MTQTTVDGQQSPVVSRESSVERGPSTDDGRLSTASRLVAEQLKGGGTPCITCSFQAEDVAVLHILLAVMPRVPVLFLDTVHHFAQTYAYRDELAARWNLNLVNLRAAEPAPGLWQTSTDACCAKHKVEPLFSALEQYDTWFTGLRREQRLRGREVTASARGHGHRDLVPAPERKSPRRVIEPGDGFARRIEIVVPQRIQ